MIPPLHSLFVPLRDKPRLTDGVRLESGWHLGSSPVWSRRQTATLAIAADRFPDPVPLLIRVAVFNASPQNPRRLTLSSPGQPDVALKVSTPKPVTVLTATPTPTEGARHSPLSLTLDTLTSPAKIGLSADERLLGLRILSVEAGVQPLSLPLDLTQAGAAQAVLQQGWALPETGTGVWSLGETAQLALPGYLRRTCAGMIRLDVEFLRRPEDGAPLRVEALCDGFSAAIWQFRSDTPGVLYCPLPGWYDDTDCALDFRLENVMSPRQLGMNADSRPLGLLLRRIDRGAPAEAGGPGRTRADAPAADIPPGVSSSPDDGP